MIRKELRALLLWYINLVQQEIKNIIKNSLTIS